MDWWVCRCRRALAHGHPRRARPRNYDLDAKEGLLEQVPSTESHPLILFKVGADTTPVFRFNLSIQLSLNITQEANAQGQPEEGGKPTQKSATSYDPLLGSSAIDSDDDEIDPLSRVWVLHSLSLCHVFQFAFDSVKSPVKAAPTTVSVNANNVRKRSPSSESATYVYRKTLMTLSPGQ